MLGVFLSGLLAVGGSAQEMVKFRIPTSPEGAVVKRNNEEWGLTGKEFSISKSKLPQRDLHLQLVRKNYKPHQLIIPALKLQQTGADGVIVYPQSPITLEPNHPLVPLQENPL